jgi:hypothetical protein
MQELLSLGVLLMLLVSCGFISNPEPSPAPVQPSAPTAQPVSPAPPASVAASPTPVFEPDEEGRPVVDRTSTGGLYCIFLNVDKYRSYRWVCGQTKEEAVEQSVQYLR